jgi:hypothetical protein
MYGGSMSKAVSSHPDTVSRSRTRLCQNHGRTTLFLFRRDGKRATDRAGDPMATQHFVSDSEEVFAKEKRVSDKYRWSFFLNGMTVISCQRYLSPPPVDKSIRYSYPNETNSSSFSFLSSFGRRTSNSSMTNRNRSLYSSRAVSPSGSNYSPPDHGGMRIGWPARASRRAWRAERPCSRPVAMTDRASA